MAKTAVQVSDKTIIKPSYYDKFHCIGGSCSFTCCQEWKIAVDDKTNARWKKLAPPEGMPTRRKNMSIFTTFKDGSRVIALDSKHKCPFLQQDGLCRIVCCYGDDLISNTCQIFPREIHHFTDRTEYTLMPCCPEVIDLLAAEAAFETPVSSKSWDVRIREYLITLLQNRSHSTETLMLSAFYLLLQLEESGELQLPTEEQLQELLAVVEERHVDPEEELEECNELFLDLIENYRREKLYPEYLTEAAELAEEIEEADTVEKASFVSGYQTFKKHWETWAALIKKLLAQEMFADLLMWDAEETAGLDAAIDLEEGIETEKLSDQEQREHMLVHFQWAVMEYCVIRHLAFLSWNRRGEISYPTLRDHIVLASRMMGYEDDDIYEYLDNSFEDLIWEWGYAALLLGENV